MKKEETIVREGRAYGADRANRTNRAYWAYGLIIGLIGLMGLMGCSKDEASVKAPGTSTEVEVASFVTLIDEVDGSNRAYGANGAYGADGAYGAHRAWEIPSGFVAYEDGVQPIGIAFTQNDHEPMIGSFFKSSDKWRTDLENIAASTSYYLYGYIPHQTAINYSITDYNGANGAYSEGAIMKLEKVPTVMPNDLCVVIGAKHGTDREHDGNNDGTNRLRMGDFEFTSASSASGNYLFLLFDHLYAALKVNISIYADYAKLRTIKLKSLQLSTQAGDETTRQRTDITIKLRATDGSVNPIENIAYDQPTTPYPAIDGGLEFWSNSAGTALTTAPQPFIGHFMPLGITRLSLTSIYDVYDTKENLIRKDCKVTNSVLLSALFSGQTQTERGKRYTINMTIQPTYLYMLSEPDLDNPTVVVNN